MTDELSKVLEALGLICKECQGEVEILVDRESEGRVFRWEDRLIVLKGSEENKTGLCYYHRKKKEGRFNAEPQGAEWSWGAKTQDEDEGEQEQALKGKVNQRQSLPWLYQDGMIFKAYIVRQTAKALLLKTKIGTFWVPKSQVDFEPQGSYTQDGHVWLPQWLIDEKGLSKEDAAEGLNFEFEWEPSLKALGPQAKPPKKKMKRGKASKGGK